MANKVLSIKMDEKDIEKLRKYYDALITAGFLSSKTMSLNAFYKHLLLDYLEDDVTRAFEVFSDYAISPRCINPIKLDENESLMIMNTYNFDPDMFKAYKMCVKETINKSVAKMKENAEMFNEVVKSHIVVTNGWMYEMECISYMEMSENNESFWQNKAFETIDLQEKNSMEKQMDEEILMIEESSISEELKQKLIDQIKEYDNKRKHNYNIMHGKRLEK